MSTTSRFLALIAVFSLLIVAPVQAGVLDGHGSALPGWAGSDSYNNGLPYPQDLIGTIDYAVMNAASFATAFPSSTYTPDAALVYLYQINNDGFFHVTADIVGLNGPGSNIGQFENAVGEVASSLFGFDTGNKAIWNFASPPIPQNASSYILAYSSNNVPEMGTAITVDGGTFGISDVPVPSATPIPEPTGLALVVAGIMALAVRRRR